ncbi:S8 family serine protease [Natronomonas pharaonis DSM 2160]|uniref:S8 family serine protease n=1 Tax=Natronomonas pharaonis (strain ATCC 35678 / DSM 2160 / CIP 103997 / JCM 8858 / NBRC 14720 / NCIMB 2260 / Gabara) TaxID=348780 RepID=A0A1U7EVA6_NATPD|nr:S8 family serine peptidase [Natronomonas pharaonis]CAI48932.1 S8 family serine protease [Natronomonas pharaonis DSM 2160]
MRIDTPVRAVIVAAALALFAAAAVAAGGVAAAESPPPTTPVDEEPDDTEVEDGRTVPSEQVPFGVRTLYRSDDVDRPSGGENVTVAVIDTGVDTDHPDLESRVSLCRDFTGESVTDTCEDRNGHGTHVAGTVAADGGDDGNGIYGVAPEAEVYAFKACTDDGRCGADPLAESVRAATDEGADIIVLSLGGREEPRISAAVAYATANGAAIIAASGNNGPELGSILYPSALNSTVSVGAVGPRRGQQVATDNYRVPDFSARGVDAPFDPDANERLEVAAPGVGVLSPVPDGDYRELSGTSMAAPHVAGLAAKLLGSPTPPESISELRERLRERAPTYDVTAGTHARGGYDPAAGFGIPTTAPPTANIGVDADVPVADEPFSLVANISEADSQIATYEWDTTGDGSYDAVGERVEVTHELGESEAQLRVTDADGKTTTVSRSVFVTDRPRVTIQAPATVIAGEQTRLNATVENEAGDTTVTWTFPDGTTATGETATYRFETGESEVTATVEDEHGATSTETLTVTATGPAEDQGPAVSVAAALAAVVLAVGLLRRRG